MRTTRSLILLLSMFVFLCVSVGVLMLQQRSKVAYCQAPADPAKAQAELAALGKKVPTFKVIDLAAKEGEVVLTKEQSLTIEALRHVELDDDPPVLGELAKPYDPRQADDCVKGEEPYVAKDIKPFRFRYFNNEFNYGGWHNFTMSDYAMAHGFNILYPYTRADLAEQLTYLPKDTKWLKWGGFVDWHKWLPAHNIPDGRYDQLMDIDLKQILTGENQDDKIFGKPEGYGNLMIDMEHGYLSPEKLRTQEWYPKNGSDAEKAAFEKKYYDGYARTYIAPVQVARAAGWQNISLYGTAPFGRMWYGLDKAKADPANDWAWNAFGKQIAAEVDLFNPSVYCFYWSPQNVAYTLANIDLNMAYVKSLPRPKSVRPYYWTLMHGGGTSTGWWPNLPLANEEERAQIAMGFFTGFDGFDTWNWSGTGSHQKVTLAAKGFYPVKGAFEQTPLTPADGAAMQFAKTLPIVRRVKCGQYHVLITYDPKVVYGDKPREIALKDFDGKTGLTLKLPADEQTRIFVIKEP